jgi:hypothetical protein
LAHIKSYANVIWVIIHLYMEMSKGNSLYSYLNKQKCHFFFFYKIGGQEGRTGRGGIGTSRREKMWGKGTGW